MDRKSASAPINIPKLLAMHDMKTIIETDSTLEEISRQILLDLESPDKQEALSFLIRQNIKQQKKLFVIKFIFYCTITVEGGEQKYTLAITSSDAISVSPEHQAVWDRGANVPLKGLFPRLAAALAQEVREFSPGMHQLRVDLGVQVPSGSKVMQVCVLNARPQGYSVSASTVRSSFLSQWEKVEDRHIFDTVIANIKERASLLRGAKKCSAQAEAILNTIQSAGSVNFVELGKSEAHLDVNNYSAVIRFINACLKDLGYNDYIVCTEGRSYRYTEYALYKQK